MTPEEIEKRLRVSLPFRGVEQRWLEMAASSASVTEHTHGQHLWRAGDPAHQFTVILSGLVKIVRPSAQDPLVAIFGPRESIGDAAVLEQEPYPADAIVASAEASIIRVRADPILAGVNSDPDLSNAMTRALLEHTRALQAKIEIMSAGEVKRRIAKALVLLGSRFGDELGDGRLVIPVPLSRAEFAALVGARTETVIRILSQWQKQGLMLTDKDGFQVLDVPRLERVAGGEA